MANVRLQVSLKPSITEMLDKLAASRGISRSALVSLLVSREWQKDGHAFSELDNKID